MRTDNTMAKRVIRRRKSNENRQYNDQRVIRRRKSNEDRQYNDQKSNQKT